MKHKGFRPHLSKICIFFAVSITLKTVFFFYLDTVTVTIDKTVIKFHIRPRASSSFRVAFSAQRRSDAYGRLMIFQAP